MMFKDTIKIMCSTFINAWKILLYQIVVILCVLGLTFVAGWPIINTLINNGFFDKTQQAFGNLLFNLNFVELYNTFANAISSLYNILTSNGVFVEACVLFGAFLVLYFFLTGLCDIGMTNVINAYMSSSAKFGFANSLVSGGFKAFLVQLIRTILLLPLIVITIVLSLKVYSSLLGVSVVLALFVTTLMIIVLFSVIVTIFSGWLPAISVHGVFGLKGFILGIKAVKRRFFRTFSTAVAFVTCIFAVNLFALSFTYGVGLLLTLPLSVLVILIFNCTMYYNSNGMRYYTDPRTIVSPRRLEQQDTFKKIKNIV